MMDRVSLFEEYRLIERSEQEVNGVWRGLHLLLFFLAFVFGSFCTFCFHMLMYLFDDNCVLFPKLLTIQSLRNSVVDELFPSKPGEDKVTPVDFLTTQWMDASACHLPTYVPLVSSIFGLVWTTMFLMCSTGSQTLTGLQRSWRVLPPLVVFSLAMGGVCVYTSVITSRGLHQLCAKLGDLVGSPECTYTVNVVTLAYERRIRGVYQAIQLTIFSAWMHTCCWLLAALLALVRILTAVDFQLVRINVDLYADIDKLLERHEEQVRTVLPDTWTSTETKTTNESLKYSWSSSSLELISDHKMIYFASQPFQVVSEMSLVPDERKRLVQKAALEKVPKSQQWIAKLVYELLDHIQIADSSVLSTIESDTSATIQISRQFGQERIRGSDRRHTLASTVLRDSITNIDKLIALRSSSLLTLSTTKTLMLSSMNLTSDLKNILEHHVYKELTKNSKHIIRSNLKHSSAQTERFKGSGTLKVHIADTPDESDSDRRSNKSEDKEKESQMPKEKQD